MPKIDPQSTVGSLNTIEQEKNFDLISCLNINVDVRCIIDGPRAYIHSFQFREPFLSASIVTNRTINNIKWLSMYFYIYIYIYIWVLNRNYQACNINIELVYNENPRNKTTRKVGLVNFCIIDCTWFMRLAKFLVSFTGHVTCELITLMDRS